MDCYYFKEINSEKGFLDSIIDCCYIMILENSPREKSVYKQLSDYIPSKKIIIQYNKGYKKCQKNLIKQSTNYDILDCYVNIFKDANKRNFDKILILEDDFIFSKKIKHKTIIKDIENLFNNYEVNIFNLGSPLTIYNPFFIHNLRYNCNKLLYSWAAHSVIYSKKFRNKLIKHYKNNNVNYQIDLHFNPFFINNMYTYKIPLAFQTFPVTENTKEWKLCSINIYKLLKPGINYFKINETPEKGYNDIYKALKWLNSIIYIIVAIILIKKLELLIRK